MTTLAMVLLAATPAVVTEMTPQLIQQAITDQKAVACYPLVLKARQLGCFTTPYSRVVAAAQDARKKYQPFSPSDVTPDMVAPELRVLAFARQGEDPHRNLAKTAVIRSVVAIVITPTGRKDQATAVHPTASSPVAEQYRNLMGATLEGTSVQASFPLDVLSESNEVHIVFDGPTCVVKAYFGTPDLKEDCPIQFKLDKVR